MLLLYLVLAALTTICTTAEIEPDIELSCSQDNDSLIDRDDAISAGCAKTCKCPIDVEDEELLYNSGGDGYYQPECEQDSFYTVHYEGYEIEYDCETNYRCDESEYWEWYRQIAAAAAAAATASPTPTVKE